MKRRKWKGKKYPEFTPDCNTWVIPCKPKVKGWLKAQREDAEKDREKRKNNLNEIHLNYVYNVNRVPEKKPNKPKRRRKLLKLNNLSKGELSKQFSKELRKKATTSETVLKNRLTKLNIQFTFQFVVHKPESFYIIDFYIHSGKICMEVDGGYHNDPEQVEKDKIRDKYLISKGYRVIRITNEDTFALTDSKLLKLIS